MTSSPRPRSSYRRDDKGRAINTARRAGRPWSPRPPRFFARQQILVCGTRPQKLNYDSGWFLGRNLVETAVFTATALALVLAAPAPKDDPSPWRADPPPPDLKPELFENGLPLTHEKGTVHVLAWATVANNYWQYDSMQAVVVKKFDRPTKGDGSRFVLAVMYPTDDPKRPWKPFPRLRVPGPPPPGLFAPLLPDAMLRGYEFYADPPTDEQAAKFLDETGWDLAIGVEESTQLDTGKVTKSTRILSAGGVDQVQWRKVLERDVPRGLFPELRKPDNKK